MNVADKSNIGKYGLITESVVAGFNNKIGRIDGIWETKDGTGYIIKFPQAIPPHNIDTLYPHHTFVEIINKIYTIDDCNKLLSDIEVLSLPRRIWCDSEATLHCIGNKLSQCHIGTSINYKLLFIQT